MNENSKELEGELIRDCKGDLQSGDLVTRTGSDVFRVIESDGDICRFICLYDETGIYDLGEEETNLARRYNSLTLQRTPELFQMAVKNNWFLQG